MGLEKAGIVRCQRGPVSLSGQGISGWGPKAPKLLTKKTQKKKLLPWMNVSGDDVEGDDVTAVGADDDDDDVADAGGGGAD